MVFVFFTLGVAGYYGFLFFPIIVLVVIGLSLIVLIKRKNYLFATTLILGFLYSFIRYEEPYIGGETTHFGGVETTHLGGVDTTLVGVFISDREDLGFGRFSQEFLIKEAKDIKGIYRERIKIYFRENTHSYREGTLPLIRQEGLPSVRQGALPPIRVGGRPPIGEGALPPIGVGGLPPERGVIYRLRVLIKPQGERAFLYSQGQSAELKAIEGVLGPDRIERLRKSIEDFFVERFSKDTASFLISITTGNRGGMSLSQREAFSHSGLAHLLSISGTHFGLLYLLVFWGVGFFIGLLPYRALEAVTRWLSIREISAVLSLPVMVFYFLISGGSIPALRSFIMICLFIAGVIIGRNRRWLESLFFAASVILLYEPIAVQDISFLLSFLAVFFISILVDRERLKRLSPLKRGISYGVLTSIAATLGTIPLSAYLFHYIPFISPLSNLIVTPMVGFIVVPLALIGGLFKLSFLVPFIELPTEASLRLTSFFASIPYSGIRVPAFPISIVILSYLSLFLAIRMRRLYIIFPAIFLIVGLSLYSLDPKDALKITFLGSSGESSVVEFPDRKTLVIDTGWSGLETSLYLTYSAISKIDAVAITHPHMDHKGGLSYLSKRFYISELWDNGCVFDESMGTIRVRHLKRGDYTKEKDYSIVILNPESHDCSISENNSSLVIKIEGRRKFLFTGDIEKRACKELLSLGSTLRADVLKIPHHGLSSSIDEEFLGQVSPSVAVLTSPKQGHEIKNSLPNSQIYNTSIDGPIKMIDGIKGLYIKRYNDYRLKTAHSLKDELENIKNLFKIW